MYKKHVILIIIVGILVFFVSWHFELQYKVIASDVMAFISIAIGLMYAKIKLSQSGQK